MHKPTPIHTIQVTDELRDAWQSGWWNGLAIGIIISAGAGVVILQIMFKL